MKLGRLRFLAGAAGTLATAGLAKPAQAAVQSWSMRKQAWSPHQHGLNGVKLSAEHRINMHMRILDAPDWELEYALGRVVFMNFFATWCPGCNAETPDFARFAVAHADQVTCIGVDVLEPDDKVRTFEKRFTIPYAIAMDQNGGFFTNLGMQVYPSTLIFRPDGHLSCAFIGEMDTEAMEAELAHALETPAA